MAYPALPDRRMPYDNDGTVVGVTTYGGTNNGDAATRWAHGIDAYLAGSTLIELNDPDNDATTPAVYIHDASPQTNGGIGLWMFFPEQREVTAYYLGIGLNGSGLVSLCDVQLQGSTDSTNGVDGTWETASLGSMALGYAQLDGFREYISTISFTGPKRAIRFAIGAQGASNNLVLMHIYGQKAAGQTPDDILFLDGLTSYAEFTAPEDFGDRPLGTTAVRTFKVKNGSATKTANTINLQCNDADFVISTDNVTWVTTINISSLAAGASSAVLYVRNTSPAIGGALGPRFARIVATVASYT